MAKTKTKTRTTTAKTPATTSGTDGDPPRVQAERLVAALEKERGGRTLYLGKVTKGMSATEAVLQADPAVQVEVIRFVADEYARLGTGQGKKEWFRGKDVPSAGAEAVRLLLRRKLPLSDDMFAEMLERLSRISFLNLVEFRDQLAGALEKRAKSGGPLSPRLSRAAKRYADVLAVRHVPAAQARFQREEWGFPSAGDRRTAERIDRVL